MSDRDAIRRVDWRFLLPDVSLSRVVTSGELDDDLIAGLLEVGAAPVTESEARTGSEALLFVRDPDARRLDRAIRSRAPSGAIVVESPSRRSRRSTIRRLRRAGLGVRTYGAWPSCSSATRYVPLGDRAELAAIAGGAKNPWRRRVGALLTRAGFGPLLFTESTSVAMVDESAAAAPVRVALDTDDGATADGTMTLLTPRFASSRHVIALVSDRAGQRRLVAKTPRATGDTDELRLEARGLTAIASGGPLRPRLVADTNRFDRRWLVQTRIDGEPLSRRHLTREPERWVEATAAWLREMPVGGASPPDEDGRSERLILPALDVLAACADREPELRTLLDDARRAFEVVRSLPLPIVCEHGDFRPPNIIAAGPDDIAAVDWELAEPRGVPLHDLWFFTSYVASVVPALGPTLRRSAREELGHLSVDGALFEPLISLASLRQLVSETVRMSAPDGSPSRAVATSVIARAWFSRLASAQGADDTEVAST